MKKPLDMSGMPRISQWERQNDCSECGAKSGEGCRFTERDCKLHMPAMRRAFPSHSEKDLCICGNHLGSVHQARSWSKKNG